MTTELRADDIFECPLCLEEYDSDPDSWPEDLPLGEVEVKALIDPGAKEVRYPNSKAHPGYPPHVDEVTHINTLTECSHSDTPDWEDAIVDTFHERFDQGYIEFWHEDPYL